MTNTETPANTFHLVEWSTGRWYVIMNEARQDWDSSEVGTRADAVRWLKARGGLVKNATVTTA